MDSTQALLLESELRAARSDLIPAAIGGEFVLPWYGGRSLANVPATVAALLGCETIGTLPPLETPYWRDQFGQVEHVVLVLLDALGYLQLQEMLALEPEGAFGRLASNGLLLPMTSICPSTTATALVTLGTGVSPATHGMLGYELWLREYGVLVEMLGVKPIYAQGTTQLLDWGFVPETFVPTPGVGTMLSAQGVRTSAHVAQQFVASALTRACYRGFERVIGHAGLRSLWDNVGEDLRQAAGRRSFHYVYWGGIDKAIHSYGADTDDWRAAYGDVSAIFGAWLYGWLQGGALPNTLVAICADHGFVSTPSEAAFASEGSAFNDLMLVPCSGESRLTYLHTLDGVSSATQAALEGALGQDYVVVEAQRALAAGLFGPGPVYSETPMRLGHYIALARGQHYIDRLNRAAWMRGRHGGLAPQEMLVPWLAARADAL